MAITPPTIADLASLMPQRVRGEFGEESGFNTATRPTATQAAAAIALAATLVMTKVGNGALSTALEDAASAAMLFKAAVLVEAQYYPEQANDDNSAYVLWQAQYTELVATLELGIRNQDSTSGPRIWSHPMIGLDGYVSD